ncbi:MAG TPA: hypothetical protein VGV59_13495 [Pyrinomonadaceae bacterium]|nr:hypothetical protein [Pyrinomonadaceae bacterium]
MRLSLRRFNSPRLALKVFVVTVAFLSAVASVAAQSRDVNFPTPVYANEITGRIQPRDLGDARLTRHFYTFDGTEGDLVITVESTDLNGDVDLFTADSLRPLTKITLYAGASSTKATKSVYLRQGEPLVLRVEGRTSGETDAVYRIRFEGAFAASTRQPTDIPETPTLAEPTARNPNSRRVTSVGARIDEPPTETAEARPAESQPTPEATPESETTTPAARRGTRRNNTRRTTPPRASASNRTRQQTPAPTDAPETARAEEARPAETTPENAAETPARRTNRSRTRPPRRSSTRREQPAERAATDAPPGAATAESASPAPPSPRLIIVTRDGETFERDMSMVHRVTVQNNQVVVVGKDGRVTRRPLADILRMSIEP